MPHLAHAVDYHVILSGSGGEEEYSERFRMWSTRLREALVRDLGVEPQRIFYLAEPETDSAPKDSTIRKSSIEAVFKSLATMTTGKDIVFIYLIGHGSYLNRTSRFLIPGPDLTAEDLNKWLEPLPVRQLVVLNGTSSSAGYINVLSGPNRIICTATKSATERNATRFVGFFIEAIEDGSADRDRDDRISVLEAVHQAAELTATWYDAEGLIATEHSVMDDNGDGLGSRLPIREVDFEDTPDAGDLPAFDGLLARDTYLKDYSFPEAAPQELIDGYLSTLADIREFKRRKDEQDENTYYAELEVLLIKAAQANREIRSYSVISPGDS